MKVIVLPWPVNVFEGCLQFATLTFCSVGNPHSYETVTQVEGKVLRRLGFKLHGTLAKHPMHNLHQVRSIRSVWPLITVTVWRFHRPDFTTPHRKKKEIEIQMNGKWIAFIQRFANQWPRKALCNIASHSTVHAHTDCGQACKTTASVSGAGALLRDTSTLEEPGIKLAALRLPVDPL